MRKFTATLLYRPPPKKKNWSNNKARMWGKRDDDEEKRAWGEKSSRLWGKRMSADQLARLLQEHGIVIPGDELQDKRKWAKNKASSTQHTAPVDAAGGVIPQPV